MKTEEEIRNRLQEVYVERANAKAKWKSRKFNYNNRSSIVEEEMLKSEIYDKIAIAKELCDILGEEYILEK